MEKGIDFKEGNISLIIDSYNDLFSDFDPRHYSQKALSDDFLIEAKRASRDKLEEGFELKFLVPEKKRNFEDERIIKRRLKEHFRKHFHIAHLEKKKVIKQGIIFCFFGVILMIAASLILIKFEQKTIITHFLVVLLEPGAWFLFWEGLNLMIFEAKKKSPKFKFYEKMSRCIISFSSY